MRRSIPKIHATPPLFNSPINYSLWKTLKKRGAFPTDEAILKVLYLGLQRIAKHWTAPIPEWERALNQFAMIVGDRVPTSD